MKFEIECAHLRRIAGFANSVVPRNSPQPILANVLIRAEEGSASFFATDSFVSVDAKVSVAVARAGATTVSASVLSEIARKMPDDTDISFEYDAASERLEIKSGSALFQLPTLSAEDFPIISESEGAVVFELPFNELKRLFSKAKIAVSTDETRRYLTGVNLRATVSSSGPVLRCAAVDGTQLALVETALPDGIEEIPSVIIPIKAVNEILSVLDQGDQAVRISLSGNLAVFSTLFASVSARPIEGNFPEYERLIPRANEIRLMVDASLMARAVNRVATVSAEKSRSIRLVMEDGRLQLSVNAAEYGSAEEELSVSYSDSRFAIKFSHRHLLDILGLMENSNAIFRLREGAAALITDDDDDDATFVVMPQRI
ncbi:MAG: DNA polymerase III subunit beta [Albidovulum sp.]|nr:DNA polymerase III subunit beta [Albidovulum sp.]MDE0532250.1 DNA polymerase III subunit beta [Albidovulum sp.]